MSLDWLSLNPSFSRHISSSAANLPFILLEGEKVVYQSPNRVSLHLNPTNLKNEVLRSTDGTIFLTNKRVVFISDHNYEKDNGGMHFGNFVLLINHHIRGFHPVNSWFGANKYSILFTPAAENAGLNHLYLWNAVFYFNNGGMFDFDHSFQDIYNQYKYDQDINNQLPRYEE